MEEIIREINKQNIYPKYLSKIQISNAIQNHSRRLYTNAKKTAAFLVKSN
jgi:hypothetical protein